MPHTRLASRQQPALVVLILDDSGSMREPLPGTDQAKYRWLEQYVEAVLKEMLARSTVMVGDSMEVRPRYYLATIVYGTSANLWPPHASRELPIDEVVKSYVSQRGDTMGLGLKGTSGRTDARRAFEAALELVSAALAEPRFRDSFPPIVLHLTDGASFSNPEPIAQQLTGLSSSDGNLLLVNALMTTRTALPYSGPEDFPGYLHESEVGMERRERTLFRMSSVVPDSIWGYLVEMGIFPHLRRGARLYFDVRSQYMLKNVLAIVGSQPVGVRT